jgi:hypothetical protein
LEPPTTEEQRLNDLITEVALAKTKLEEDIGKLKEDIKQKDLVGFSFFEFNSFDRCDFSMIRMQYLYLQRTHTNDCFYFICYL